MLYNFHDIDLTWSIAKVYGLYLQSLKDCVQFSHNFTKANLTLISYFYNPLVLLNVDDFDFLSFDLGIDERRFKVELDFKVVCDVVSTYGYFKDLNLWSEGHIYLSEALAV